MERKNTEIETQELFPIIGVIGPNGAGKDTIAQLLHNNFGMEIFRTSDILTKLAGAQGANISQSEEFTGDIQNALDTQEGPGGLAKVTVELADATRALKKFDGAIITGIKTQADAQYIKNIPNGYLVAIDASATLRYHRILHREREEKSKTWEEFQTLDSVDKEKIYQLFPLADEIIDNSDGLDDLEQQLIRYVIEETKLF